ncbi:unnamed protein product [Amoebophrya sp. A25]|nr:unnamed protein product [Amoebophrya sp. A25]|eukprot:GSA25T00004648001.1
MLGGVSKPVFFKTAAAVFLIGATTGVEGRRKMFHPSAEETQFSDEPEVLEQESATPAQALLESADGETVGLVLVDIQKCFTGADHPTGLQLQTIGGEGKGGDKYKAAVVNLVRKFRKKYPNGPIAMGQDYHPAGHVSFVDEANRRGNHPYNEVGGPERVVLGMTRDTFDSNNEDFQKDREQTPVMTDKAANVQTEEGFVDMEQPLFPDHCIAGSPDVNFIDGLCDAAQGIRTGVDTCGVPEGDENKLRVIRKGFNMGIDSFSMVFDNRMLKDSDARKELIAGEKAHIASNGLAEWLHRQGVTKVFITGIADDFCVKSTAFDLLDTEAMAQIADKAAFKVVHLKETAYGIVRGLRDQDQGPLDNGLRKEYRDREIELSSVEKEKLD